MLNKLKTSRAGVLAFDAIGKVTDEDYRTTLIPAIEAYLKTSEQAHLLIRFGPEFEGYSAHAAADDALLGLRHLHDFERIAVITDHHWIAQGLRMFGPLMPAKVKVFALDEEDEALTWVAW